MEYLEKPYGKFFCDARILKILSFLLVQIIFYFPSRGQFNTASVITIITANNDTALPGPKNVNIAYRIISPFLLQYFKSSRQENMAILEWKTTEEKDSATIVIERSFNSIQWNKIASLPINGYQNNKKYTYEDEMTQAVKYYYRLRIILNNSQSYFSDVNIVDNRDTRNFASYPNPARSIMNIKNIDKVSGVSITNPYSQQTHPAIIRSSGEEMQYRLLPVQKKNVFR